MNKSKDVFLSIATAGLIFGSTITLADSFSPAVDNEAPCPVNPAYPDGTSGYDGSSLSGIPADQVIDAEFGPGAQALTQCLKKRKKAKIVVRVNDTFREDAFRQARLQHPTFLSNLDKLINQNENTHAMKIGKEIDIRVVLGGSGAALATTKHVIFAGAAKKWNAANPDKPQMTVSPVNPYAAKIQQAIDAGIIFYLCQEASRTLGITMNNKLPGIYFVPAAHSATADFIQDGYAILLP